MSSGITFTDLKEALEYAKSKEEEGLHVEITRKGPNTWKATITKKVSSRPKVIVARKYERIGATAGVADRSKGVIIVRERTKTPENIAHEEYHMRYGDSRYWEDPRVFTREELEANLYSYLKTGKPKSIIRELRGIWTRLFDVDGSYKIHPPTAEKMIREEMEKLSVPQRWLVDMTKHEKEVEELHEEVYKGGKPITEEEWKRCMEKPEKSND